jgi:hypothetical protein
MKLFKNNFHHNKRVEKVALKTNIEPEIVEEALDIMYGYIRDKFDKVDVPKETLMDEDEFNEKFPVICIPSLGYFKPSYKKYKHIIKNKNKKKNGRKK